MIIRMVAMALIAVFLAACGKPAKLMGAQRATLLECLAMIKSSSGFELNTLIDRPDNVSGYLAGTKRDFACTKEESGTQGVYWDGWFEVE